MRRILALATIAALACGAALAAGEPSQAERADVQHVISGQIEAFRHGDGAAALGFAAPGIRAKFTDATAFLSMVRTAYAPVIRPRSFTFGAVLPHGGLLLQKVEFVGEDGAGALALYEMEHETDGTWRIAGCILGKSEQISL